MKHPFLIMSAICLMIAQSSLHSKEIKLDDLAFLSGQWTAEIGGTSVMETWSDTRGDKMIGMHKDVHANGKTSFEFLRIEKTAEAITYYASPAGKPATPFKLKILENNTAVFENLAHDFPARIIYRLEGEDMVVRIEDESGKQGMEWRWQKAG